MTTNDRAAPPGPAAAGPTQVNWLWRFLRGLVGGLFTGLLRWRHHVDGIEHVPINGPAVVTWNHHSYSDFLLLALAIVRERGRIIRLLGKAEVWDNPVLARIADGAGAVPVHRGARGGGGALESARAALEAGDIVGLAPEQTISESFELLPFASGAARLARDTGAPVIPTAGWGSHRFSTKGHTLQWAVGIPVVTSFGEPVHVGPDDDVAVATERIRRATEELLHRIQADYPDQPDPDRAWWVPHRLGGTAPTHDEVLAAHAARRATRGSRDGG